MSDTPSDAPAHNVVDKDLSTEMHESYLQYAMSVIKSRALPDIRDGLKPSQRRVLYTMQGLGIGPRSQRMKSARVVGECMGKYHPHGDQAIYATLVRMAQPFATRYQLVDPKGNFGSISDPTPAAMRYTECRMAQAAVDMVADIDRNTVDMTPNYDEREVEPVVLPSKFPNLLCNGSQGIAVGMATSIPPHNLTEVCDALVTLARAPETPIEALMKLIPGPDFPTAGTICGRSGIRQAYTTGRGHLTVRGKVEIETKKDRATIVITELPYQVTTELLKEKIQEAYKAGRIDGLSDIKDYSKGGIRIVLECKKGEDPNVIVNQLYKFTPLQDTFSVIMLALDKGNRPRVFNLKEMLEAFVEHRYEVIRRRTKFLLEQARDKIHILEGLQAAVDAIDDVIKIVRGAKSPDEARQALRSRLKQPSNQEPISEKQANAILAMQLQRLTGLERDKLSADLTEQRTIAADLADILERHERVVGIFVSEMEQLRRAYGDKRRTAIEIDEAAEIDIEDLIADEAAIVSVTHEGYIKRTALDQYRLQGRAGKGVYGATTRDDDFVSQIFQASTKDYVLCFTSKGRVHWVKVHQIPEGSRTARGRSLRNLISLLPDEQVTSLIPIAQFDEGRILVMCTAQGVVKKTQLSAFARPKKGGIVAVSLDEGDTLVGVRVTDGKRELVMATREGKAIRFPEETVRAMGRAARGVKGMVLEGEDLVCSLVVVGEDGPELLTVCDFGHGKRTPVEDYRETNRGGKGIINIKTGGRNGSVVGVVAVQQSDQVMIITSSGKTIRVRVEEIPSIGRNTQGVRIIKVEEGERVVAVAKVVAEEAEAEAMAEKPARPAAPPAATTDEAAEEADEDEGGEE
ncbi:MAG: DNA gyrase subunit A [Planctomycetes bacterium]|nr:DNA gyrase subunit A [Planctomycetota bacterium]